jgi:uncharacterized surface protein with fasciclin (FAS1) repeats
MNPYAVAAAATALAIGAGAGAVTSTPPPQPAAEVMNPMIGGEAMQYTSDIAGNVAVSPEHTVLAADLKQSGVDSILRSQGPYTLFAPANAAFASSGGSVSKQELTKLLDYHIVRGRLDSKALLALIGEGGGRAKLSTLEGGTLIASLNGPTNIVLQDETGQTADIAIYDIYQTNGVIQVIDKVLRTKSETSAQISQR